MQGIGSGLQGNVLRMAKVVAAHSEENAVDVVFIDNGTKAAGVQVMAPAASTKHGTHYIPRPTQPDGVEDKWDLTPSNDRDIYCVVAMVDQFPVVLGFMFPQVTHLAFGGDGAEAFEDARIDRHASDVEIITLKDGSHTIRHPCGTNVTVGSVPALEGKDFDKVYEKDRNMEGGMSVFIESFVQERQSGDESEDDRKKKKKKYKRIIRARVAVDKSGAVTIQAFNDNGQAMATGQFSGGGSASIWAEQSVTVQAGGNVTVQAPRVDLNP